MIYRSAEERFLRRHGLKRMMSQMIEKSKEIFGDKICDMEVELSTWESGLIWLCLYSKAEYIEVKEMAMAMRSWYCDVFPTEKTTKCNFTIQFVK